MAVGKQRFFSSSSQAYVAILWRWIYKPKGLVLGSLWFSSERDLINQLEDDASFTDSAEKWNSQNIPGNLDFGNLCWWDWAFNLDLSDENFENILKKVFFFFLIKISVVELRIGWIISLHCDHSVEQTILEQFFIFSYIFWIFSNILLLKVAALGGCFSFVLKDFEGDWTLQPSS